MAYKSWFFFLATKGQVKSNSSDDSCDTFKIDVIVRGVKPVMHFWDAKAADMDAGIIITHSWHILTID